MPRLFLICLICFFFSCGTGKEKKNKDVPKDTTTIKTTTTQDKSYLKKRPEEFKEFFFLTDVVPFTGKIATKKDVQNKEAVFNMDSKKDPSHRALKIRLPFFAFLLQPNNDPSKFVVIVQAETLRGDTMLGYKESNGLFGICKPRELEYFESQKNTAFTTIQ